MSGLDAVLKATVGDLNLDVSLRIAPGESVALVGPNGAGKSTIVRLLVGLERLDGGTVELDGRVLDDPGQGVFVAPRDRPVGVAFQQNLLFGHMTTLENVAFGMRSRGTSKRDAHIAAQSWLDRVGVGQHADRRIEELSGGQQRRISVARALAGEPDLVVLDEPFAGLDATARAELRTLLIEQLRPTRAPYLVVAHDPVDALATADRIVVVESGRVTQRGTPAEIRQRPATSYVADLVGTNLLRGHAVNGRVAIDDAELTLSIADSSIAGPVLVRIEPQAIALHAEAPGGSPRNAWQVSVAAVHDLGDVVRVSLDQPTSLVVDLTPGAVAELGLGAGASLWAAVKATSMIVSTA